MSGRVRHRAGGSPARRKAPPSGGSEPDPKPSHWLGAAWRKAHDVTSSQVGKEYDGSEAVGGDAPEEGTSAGSAAVRSR